jgi:molybdopterin molybdotransferase
MISFDDAYRLILSRVRVLPPVRVALSRACGRVLREAVIADRDSPPFDKSAMDGFSCRRADLGHWLKIVENLPAGQVPTCEVEEGTCSRIMTGAVVPPGADCVFMVEHSEESAGRVRFSGETTSDNICRRGEDGRAGGILLEAGRRLKAADIAVLASCGCAKVLVSRRPRVGVTATGDELVDAAGTPREAQIRNSNSPQLLAQLHQMGLRGRDFGIALDDIDDLTARFDEALRESDVVLLTGGVSMGDLDLVKNMLRAQEVEVLCEQVAVKPGKPTVFGVVGEKYVFGLPGNPVSTHVLFEVMVQPFLLKLMGCDDAPPRLRLRCAADFHRARGDRLAWMPLRIDDQGEVHPVHYRGSGHFHALCAADGLLAMPRGCTDFAAGSEVDVRLL